MCIVAIAWQLFDEMPLVLLSNRDEFLQRPTTPAHQWQDNPIFAGRDNKSGGTWLGYNQQIKNGKVSQNGRWAAVLNFRDGLMPSEKNRTRGDLVTDFLSGDASPMSYARQINLQDYAGFNLIVGDSQQVVVVNNRGYPPTAQHNGLHVFSNGQPDDEWFKTERLRGRIRQEVLPLIAESLEFNNGNRQYWETAAWEVLSDSVQASDESQLPDTGVPLIIEQSLSSIYIENSTIPNYGTRTQSILTLQCSKQALKNSRFKMHMLNRER